MHNRAYISSAGLRFEWAEAKNRANYEKHGVAFETATGIFDGATFDRVDDRKPYGEKRIISCGRLSEKIVVTVVHTKREGAIRIISARPASREERRAFEKAALHKTPDA